MRINGAGSLFRLAVETLQKPKRCLRIVLDIVLTMPELLQATVLVASLSTILSIMLLQIEPAEVQDALHAFSANPVPLFLMQVATFLGIAALVTHIGRIFQGHGTFKEALTALVWLQIIMFGVSIIQLILGLIIPQISPIVFLLSMMILIHLSVSFIMEIHGFNNAIAVISGIVVTFFGLAFLLAILLIMLGITPEAIQQV